MNIRILFGRCAPPPDPFAPDQLQLVAARELHATFEANEIAAELVHRGQHILVNGVVDSVVRAGGCIVVQLDTGEEHWPVHCLFPETEAGVVALLHKGEPVLVMGRCRGRVVRSVVMTGCRLTEATIEGSQMAG
jgi:hypothetical protein